MVMYIRQRLSERNVIKRHFDPSSKEDRLLAYKFLKLFTWKDLTSNNTCPFFCEYPYLEIPAMLRDKLVDYYSSKELKTPD